jgi:hypothetical protein
MSRKWSKETRQLYPLHPLALEHMQLEFDALYATANGLRNMPVATNANSKALAKSHQEWLKNGREA